MSLTILVLVFLAVISSGYFGYSGFLRRVLSLDDSKTTPAYLKNDGNDFIPTKAFYLFGQHFSAIAAAGPIAGPIVACQLFGWGPSLLWITVGVICIGAVHDFTSLFASLRHEATSIADMARLRLGSSAGFAMMIFIWIALLYIIVAFADITAGSFVSSIEEIEGIQVNFNAGGAVAAASVLYLLLSISMGFVQRYLNPPFWVLTLIFVPLAFFLSFLGTKISTVFLFSHSTWTVLITLYCAIASLLPVWMLLQPRGFLGGFILYFALAIGTFGIFFGGYEIQQPFFKGWAVEGATGSLFPFLFVTIACGACSGFHGLVCSGTTSKQIDKESDCRTVGYGAMLAEGFVAFIALAIVMILLPAETKGLKPGTIYGNGIGKFLSLLIGKENLPLAITIGAMAFSTFVFDTLDVSCRLGRYLIQEITGWRNNFGAAAGTILTAGIPLIILLLTPEGGWVKFWTLFGASNQLLAALSLMVVSAWLKEMGKPFWFTFFPMLFVLAITVWALGSLALSNFAASSGIDIALLNATLCLVLIGLAAYINFIGFKKLRVP